MALENHNAPIRAYASMKALPKRKGNLPELQHQLVLRSLNESPSEKEGKSPSCAMTAPAWCRPQ